MSYKRVFVIVMDSVGIGSDNLSYLFNDDGANTLEHIASNVNGLNIPTLNALGIADLGNIQGTNKVSHPYSYTMKLNETSIAKDTLTGHWEMMGIRILNPLQTFTENGFPQELIETLEKETGHKVIGNKAASGTEILNNLVKNK